MEGEYGEQPQREDDRPDDPIRDAALALCEAVERFFGRGQPETLPLCGCIVCQARALRAALAPERDRLADFLDDKAGACAGAELAAENTEQAFVAQVEETMFRAAAAALRATPSELTTDQKALVREVDRRFAEALEPSDEEVARELAKDEHYNLFHPNERMKWATEAVRAVYAARQRAKENK